MKGILLSVRRKWADKLFSSEKSFELRKTSPRDREFLMQLYRPVYLYVPESGFVEGCAIFNGSRELVFERARLLPLGMTDDEIERYGPGRDGLFHCWGLGPILRYDYVMQLAVYGVSRPPQSWRYVEVEK